MRGGDLSDRSVVWEDVESAFEGRLKTGIIVNLEHLDIQDYLANAEIQFLREMQKSVEAGESCEGQYYSRRIIQYCEKWRGSFGIEDIQHSE